MAGFFRTIFAPDKEAVEKLHAKATHQSDRVVRAAYALQETIKEMVNENDRLTKRQPPNENIPS